MIAGSSAFSQKKGKTVFLLKAGSKRRRRKAEIEVDEAVEAKLKE